MTIKGRLLLSTAIVKLFQTENIPNQPSDRLPFPLDFRNHYGNTKIVVVGATPKKIDDICIRCDTMPACDRHPATLSQQ